MERFSYRQPAVGQIFGVLTEGDHKVATDGYTGRYLLICCYGSLRLAEARTALDFVAKESNCLDGVYASFLGVSIDPGDKVAAGLKSGIDFILDTDGELSRQCGASPLEAVPLGTQYRVTWTILDPSAHVAAHFQMASSAETVRAVFSCLEKLVKDVPAALYQRPAPVLILPNLFDDKFCERLTGLYEAGQPRDSGFMRQNEEIFDYSFKRRRDFFVTAEADTNFINRRIQLCLIPEIRKLFFMSVTRMERYLIGCYSADEKGHFKPHRDNGQKVTAHRRFAVSIALNEDYDGGELVFPEYSQMPHKIPKGWGLVFPCAILHAVRPVTRGRRYAFLPFLYDEAGAAIKDKAQA